MLTNLFTPVDVALALRLPVRRVKQLAENREISHLEIAGELRFTAQDVARFIRRQHHPILPELTLLARLIGHFPAPLDASVSIRRLLPMTILSMPTFRITVPGVQSVNYTPSAFDFALAAAGCHVFPDGFDKTKHQPDVCLAMSNATRGILAPGIDRFDSRHTGAQLLAMAESRFRALSARPIAARSVDEDGDDDDEPEDQDEEADDDDDEPEDQDEEADDDEEEGVKNSKKAKRKSTGQVHRQLKSEFRAAIADKMQGGMSRTDAVRAVVREQPLLQECLVITGNENRPNRQPTHAERRRGVPESFADMKARWQRHVAQEMRAGLSRDLAVRSAAHKYPRLRAQYVALANGR